MSLDYEKIMEIARSVASSVSNKFPSYVQADDTEATLLLWVVQNASQIEKAVEDGPGWEAKIASTLRKVAFDHCNSEKAAAEGYDPSDNYIYSTSKIESLIADSLVFEDWQSFGAPDSNESGIRVPAITYGERLAELADVKRAISKMDDDTKTFIKLRYIHFYTYEELGNHFGLTESGARSRHKRALKGLQKQLGYKDPQAHLKAARRPHRSNAAARADLSNHYEG